MEQGVYSSYPFVAGAFQAFRGNDCPDTLRNVSNCGGSLERHDFIGDYLGLMDCDVLKDLDAIDCHPYSFIPGSTTWTYPENPVSQDWQIRNMAGWLYANKYGATGVLSNTRLWSTEYGFDSNPTTGVGEKTQAAYLLRGLLLHSRYHFEKIFFYNAFDHSRTTDPYYSGLYNSSGLWKQGTHPQNNAWPSPLIEHGAVAKPAWYGLMDLKTRIGDHVFYKALVEDGDAFVYLMAKVDGSDPYLLFWSPKATNDGNINQDIALQKAINWSSILPENYSNSTGIAQTFAQSATSGETFIAADGTTCGSTTLTKIRRCPAFIRLTSCGNCPTVGSFNRYPISKASCNSAGDYYFEVVLNNISVDDQITLSGMPTNGLNTSMSSLNGVAFTPATFLNNTQFVNDNTLRWLAKANNGGTQTLKLAYCWANAYPNPVTLSTATSLCSGVTTACINAASPRSLEPGEDLLKQSSAMFQFTVQPNPGTDHLLLTYFGAPHSEATLKVMSSTGQILSVKSYFDIENMQQWRVDTNELPRGMYFLCLQTGEGAKYALWEKY